MLPLIQLRHFSALTLIHNEMLFQLTYSVISHLMTRKVAEEEVDARVKEFLGSIATFQEKLKVGANTDN